MKNVALHNLGCKVNGYEIDVMQQRLEEKGYKIVPFDKKADIYIINTCTVTNMADRKSRQMLHRAKKNNPDAIVVAVGCYVQTGKEDALLDESIDLAIGNNRKKDLVPILEEFLAKREKSEDISVCQEEGEDAEETGFVSSPEEVSDRKTLSGKTLIDINQTDEYEEMQLKKTGEHTRAFIKIQDGCNQFCSYCIIPYARGRVRSRKEEDVLSEVRELVKNGYREVVLTGIHLSSYGLDFDGIKGIGAGESFPYKRLLHLIKEIHAIDGLDRIRLGSLEPRIITEEFVKELSMLPKICPHFHLSLQSGCGETLKRMNRKYTPEEYYDRVCILRRHFCNPAITTDVIVGFPGETEEEFEETCRFLEKVGFCEMHVFKYSKRQNTVAAAMKEQVPEEIKSVRSDRLLAMDEALSKQYRESYLQKKTGILFEEAKEIDGRIYQVGHSKEYLKAAFACEKDLAGQIVKGTFTGFLGQDILLFEREAILSDNS